MKENNNSSYKMAKRGFYSRMSENNKKNNLKLFGIALAGVVLAVILLFTASYLETSAGKYSYVYGEQNQKIAKNQAFSGDVRLLDMNALADYCGFEKIVSGSKATYRINGTEAIFENLKSTATVNGFSVEMPAKASIKNGYCLIPLSTAQDLILGVNFEVAKKTVSVQLNGSKIFMIAKPSNIEYIHDEPEYKSAINSTEEYIRILVNKSNPVDEEFPEDKDSLLEIPGKYRKSETIYLYKTALTALEAMMEDMFSLGYTDIEVTSAYRNFNKQTQLFENYIQSEMNKGYSYNEALYLANKYSARPEHSEHRTGLSVDFWVPSVMDELENYGSEGQYKNDVGFAETEVYTWLLENAWKYGFILRYPDDKVDITGYQYESWHYRFVGIEISSVIQQTGLCYEEYLEYFGD